MYDANVRGGLEVYMDESYGKDLTIFYKESLEGTMTEITGDLIIHPVMGPDMPRKGEPQDGIYEKGISICGHILPHMHIKSEDSDICLDDEEVILQHFRLPDKKI